MIFISISHKILKIQRLRARGNCVVGDLVVFSSLFKKKRKTVELHMIRAIREKGVPSRDYFSFKKTNPVELNEANRENSL